MSKILIIEDEMTIVDLISFNLKREGFEIDAAYDGVTGLEKALSGWADLILLDVMLPGMNGFDLLQKLRQESDVPVIMVTAREEDIYFLQKFSVLPFRSDIQMIVFFLLKGMQFVIFHPLFSVPLKQK